MSEKRLALKYLVIGDSGVGKTSLLLRYCEDAFRNDYLSTIGVDFKIRRFDCNGTNIILNIWDTAGQERFRNITKSFYKGAHGIILAYSITDLNSYHHIENWVDQIRESGNLETSMILVGSKSDLEADRKVSTKQGQALATKYGIKFLEASAKTNDNITTVFTQLTEEILAKKGKTPEITTTVLRGGNDSPATVKQNCC